MKNIKKKIEVFCLVMMMCAMSIVPNMNVNAAFNDEADVVDGKYGTFTRIEPTADQIASHDKIQYYAGSCSASLSISDLGVWHTASADNVIDDDSKYVFPYSVRVASHANSNWDGNFDIPGTVYVFAYNDFSLEKNDKCLVCKIPFSAPNGGTASTSPVVSNSDNTTKYYANHFGTYIKMEYDSMRSQDHYNPMPPDPYNSRVDVSVYFNAYPDPYIDTALSNITPVVEGANVPLDGTAEFPCANEYKSYQWQYATSSSYTDSAAASADDTETKWTDCTDGTLYGSSKASVLTIKSTPKSLNKYYYRCKYDTGLPGSVISYSNATQLLVTDANITSITAKTKNKSYEVGDTVSLSDITVTTNWDNSNIIDVIGTSLTGCQLYDGDTLLDGGTYTCDTLYKDDSKKTLKVVYNPDNLDLSAVASDMIAEVSFNVTDTTAPKIDSAVVANSDNSALTVSTTSSDKKNILVSASDNYTKADSLSYKLSKYNTSTKKYDAIAAYTDWSSNYDSKTSKSIFTITGENGNGTYGIIVKDEFGNASNAFTFPVQIWDNTAPTINPSITPDTSKPSTYRMIKLNASDGDASNTNIVNNSFKYFVEPETSGYTVKSFSDINDWSTADGFIVTKESIYHLYCADKYGNMVDSKIDASILNLDDEPPVVSSSVSNPDSNDAVTVTLKVKDNMSTMTKDSIAITPNDVTLSDGAKDGDWTIYTFTTKNMNDYTVKVSDDAGNSTDVVISAGQALSQTFTVKFLSEDGQVLKTENVVYGHSATPPTAEGKDGYTFNGWTGSFQNVTSDISLYARFAKDAIKYVTVHYNTDGGNTIQDAQVESGSRAPYQKPIKSGYVFNGWYTDSNKGVLYDFGQGVTSETTIYASWSVDKTNKLTNAELQDLLDKAKSSVTAQTKTVTATKTEVKTVAEKDDPNVHKYTDSELQKLLEEARATGYKEGSASVKPEKIYIKAQAKAKDNNVTVSEDPRADVNDSDLVRADVNDSDLVSVKFSLPEGRTFAKKLTPGTPIIILDSDGQHIKDFKAENGLIIDLTNDSDNDLEEYNAYDLNDKYMLKQTCIEDEDTALAGSNKDLTTDTITKEDKTSSISMKTIGIISGISLAGIGLIIWMAVVLKKKKRR